MLKIPKSKAGKIPIPKKMTKEKEEWVSSLKMTVNLLLILV